MFREDYDAKKAFETSCKKEENKKHCSKTGIQSINKFKTTKISGKSLDLSAVYLILGTIKKNIWF